MRYLALITFAFAFACGGVPPANYPTVAPFDETKMPLGPADKIQLVVYYGSKDIHAQYTIDAAGDIEVQYIGTVKVTGKTTREVQDEIRQRLADGYIVDPIVSITLAEINSQKLSVFGQVARSGPIKFSPGLTITEAIASSGGFAPLAKKNMVQVTRHVDGRKEIYKIPVEAIAEGNRPNFPLMPGDEVFVPERAW
jgi:polysaccharide biosynthesis/export protein